jgi:hypothetical protein
MILRHDLGLAASPGVPYMLKREREFSLRFLDHYLWVDDLVVKRRRVRRCAGPKVFHAPHAVMRAPYSMITSLPGGHRVGAVVFGGRHARVRVQDRPRGLYAETVGCTTKWRAQGRMTMAGVDDPMKAWLAMIEQFQKAGLGSAAPEFMQTMLAPMQQQLDLVQKALEAQAAFNRELTEQAFAPMRQMFEGLKQAVNTTRAAGEALKQAGDLLTQQATAMDQALSFTRPFLDFTAPRSERSAKAD